MALLVEMTTSGQEYNVKDISQADLSTGRSGLKANHHVQFHPLLPTSFALALLSSSITDRPSFEEGQGSEAVSLPADVACATDLISHGKGPLTKEKAVSVVLPSWDLTLSGPSSGQNLVDGGVIESEGPCRCFRLDEVLKATNLFDYSFILGTGGFGVVYKGFINDGPKTTAVAVKRRHANSNQGAEEFFTEVKLLSQVRHPNLVSLIGYCNEGQEMILVYEFIALGTLAYLLYKSRKEESSGSRRHLTWAQRLKICIGVARGLNYLHTGTQLRAIHRDVKSTNILVDENLVPKVSDFGISKLIASQSTTHVSTEIKGTVGYRDPDYMSTSRLTWKSDVYSLGMVMLEVLCGRPPIDTKLEEEQIGLIYWAKEHIKSKRLDQIIDPSLKREITPQSLKYFAELAYDCLQSEPEGRPTMSQVVIILEIALVLHEHEGGSQGTITKVFHARQSMPKGMHSRRGERPLNCLLTRACRRFSLDEIRDATNIFDEDLLISKDGWFELYKGYAVGGTPVMAIKRYDSMERFEECLAEIRVHSLNRHSNITSLIGFCDENHELILVYDYMLNGTLRSHLYETNNDPLRWKQRLEICIDIARGLAFLHTNTQQQFIHVNVKSSAVYLYDECVAKIADFEISIPIDTRLGTKYCCEGLCGTIGYLDPEYSTSGNVTKKSDVYAFGILLLEILCAKRPCDLDPNGGEVLEWVDRCMERRTINQIIDPYLIGKIAPDCLLFFVSIAMTCLSKEGIQRPCMDDVLHKLQYSLELQ